MQLRPCEYTLIVGHDLSDQVTLALQNGAVLHGQPFAVDGKPAQAVVYLGHFYSEEERPANESQIISPPEKKVLRPV